MKVLIALLGCLAAASAVSLLDLAKEEFHAFKVRNSDFSNVTLVSNVCVCVYCEPSISFVWLSDSSILYAAHMT